MKTLLDDPRKQRLALYTKISNFLQGNIAEVGVYQGGSAEIISKNKNKQKKFYLFDTFEGMPKTDKVDQHKEKDFNDTSYENICNAFKSYQNVFVYKGIFPQKHWNIVVNEKFSLVHLDVDIYKSYKDCLNFFYPKMVVGGLIIMDDYNAPSCLGAKLAVDEFIKNKPEKLVWNVSSQVVLIKTQDHIFSTLSPKCLS